MTDEPTTGTADQLPSETSAVVEALDSGDTTKAVRPWKSVAGMRRSKGWKQVERLFSPEGQAALAQEIMDRVAPRFANQEPDETLAAKLPGDRHYYDGMKKRSANVVPLPQKFWLEKIATLRATRLQLHVKLKETEDQINAAQALLDNARTTPKPNGHDTAA